MLSLSFKLSQVYEFQTKGNSYEDICWVLVRSYLSLGVSHQAEFLWRHWLSVSLKLCNFVSFKPQQILMKIFLDSLFEVMYVYEFQTKANSYEDISWVSVWSYGSLWVSSKSEFLCRRLLTRSLKLFKFMCFNQNLILMKTFLESEFKIM